LRRIASFDVLTVKIGL